MTDLSSYESGSQHHDSNEENPRSATQERDHGQPKSKEPHGGH